MKNIKVILLCICLIVALKANSQIKKSSSQAKVSAKAAPITHKGPLDPQNYNYYFFARRGSTINTNGTYILKDVPPTATNLSGPLVMMDIRTMKELTWWPEIEMSVKQNNIFGYVVDRQGPVLVKYDSTGKFIFSKYLVWKTPTGEMNQLFKSSDDKQVYSIYNNDAWIGKLDLLTGNIGAMHQITQNGLMNSYDNSYLRNNTLLMAGYMINTADGSYQKIGYPQNIANDTCPLFYTPKISFYDNVSAIWNFETRKKALDINGTVYWLDRGQTKILYETVDGRGQPARVFININPKLVVGNRWGEMKGVDSWQATLATRDGEMWGPLLEVGVSPNSKKLFTFGTIKGTNKGVIFVDDYETKSEETVNIDTGEYPPSHIAWTDDTHIIFSLKADERLSRANLNGQLVNTENQGTYILNIENKEIKRITPYFINNYEKNFIRLLGAKTIIFEANNYLFKCNTDGTEFIQLTKIPNVYKLESAFIK